MGLLKGAAAAAGCIALQVPYAVSGDSDDAGAVGRLLMKAVPISVDSEFDGYSNHWWWDNAAHILAGYAVGTALSFVFRDTESVCKAFLTITSVWEVFEYKSGERPWHTDSEGNMVFAFDHAMEDTALDTVAGLVGAYLAAEE